MNKKDFKTLDEQLQIYEKKGLTAKKYLQIYNTMLNSCIPLFFKIKKNQ